MADMLGFFREVDGLWRKHGFEVAFRKLEEHPKCNLRARLSATVGGERDLADILQIKDLACKAIHEVGPTPEALITWLTDRINASDDKNTEKDAEEYARELESESDAVKIMTIHVSKGLQYPVVFIVLPAKDGIKDGPYPYHDDYGRLIFSAGQRNGPLVILPDEYKEENYRERIRLLYVAMTRAKQRTIVIKQSKVVESWPTDALLYRAQERIANGALPSVSITSYENDDPVLPDYEAKSGFVGEFCAAPETTRHLESKRPSRGSYTSLAPVGGGDADGKDYDPDTVFNASGEDGDEVHPIFKLAGGTKAGICWHEILEKIPFNAGITEILDLTRKTLRIHGLANEDEEQFTADVSTIGDMISKTLNFRLASPNGSSFSLSETDPSARLSEWEFYFPSRAALPWTSHIKDVLERHWKNDPSKLQFIQAMAGWIRPVPEGFLKGFLDLVFRHGDYYYVVDWKSNQLTRDVSGFTRKGVLDEMAKEGYFFQYMLYLVVLHRFLKETLGKSYSWERNFGGVRYYFLRGIAAGGEAPVYADRPSAELLDELSTVLGLEG